MDPREERLGLAAAGVWTTTTARLAGLTDDDIRGRLARGEWQALRPGTYADAGVTPDAFMRASSAVQAACTVRRVAVAAGRTAARMWGLPLVDDEDPATQRFEAPHDDVALTFGQTTASTLHSRQLVLSRGDVCLIRGIPVLTLPRTLADLAVVLRPDALVCALDHVLHAGLVDRGDLERLVLDRRSTPGAVALRTAVELCDGRAESPLETLTRLLLRPVLPDLEPQLELRDRFGRVIARVDMGVRALRFGVEADGATFHGGRAAEDRRRDARTGWTIERCTWFDTRVRGRELQARVLTTVARLRARAT